MKNRRLHGAGLRNALTPLRKGLLVILAVLFFSVTAYALSSVAHKNWSSKLEKGEYKGDEIAAEVTVDEDFTSPDEAIENEKAPHHVFVIVSESQQILVVTPDEPVNDEEDTGAEIEEPVIDTESIAVEDGIMIEE